MLSLHYFILSFPRICICYLISLLISLENVLFGVYLILNDYTFKGVFHSFIISLSASFHAYAQISPITS